jgi:hypothetical protein
MPQPAALHHFGTTTSTKVRPVPGASGHATLPPYSPSVLPSQRQDRAKLS